MTGEAPRPGRGRLSSIDLLPPEVDDIVAWASGELTNRDRTQVDIHAEFVERLEERRAEFGGDLDFDIPGLRSFNRHSMRLAKAATMLDRTREITAVLAAKYDPKTSDDLTILTAETIKTLVFSIITSEGEVGMANAKDVKSLAEALRAAMQAQGVSSERRRKAEAEFETKVKEAVTTVGREKGLSAETVEAIQAQVLGISA